MMKYFSDDFYDHMDNKFKEIYDTNSCMLAISNQIIDLIRTTMLDINVWLSKHKFNHSEEEIHFFKNQKPRLVAKLNVHLQIIEIEANVPTSQTAKIKYYSKKINWYDTVAKKNNAFKQYIKSKETNLDRSYFIRKSINQIKFIDGFIVNYDKKLSTSHDYLMAEIMANEEIIKYLEDKIDHCKNKSTNKINTNLQWTGNKIELTELIYALHTNKSINNGKTDIKELAIKLGQVFNLNIEENIYRNYLDIKNRKFESTKFLNTLSKSLQDKMQQDDS